MPIIKTYTGSLDDNIIKQNINENGINIEYPFGNNKRSFNTTYTTLNAAKSNIKMLFDTQRGERIMNPDVGIDLTKYLFEPINEATKLAIRKDITNNIEKYVPSVFIKKLNINISNENIDRNIISININFGLKQQPNLSDSINITV